jgi:serine/threonine-protein kinase
MSPDDSLVLDPSVVIIALAELPAAVRGRFEDGEQQGYALTRRRGRAPSTLIDAALAELLDEFRSPTTIVEAIIRYSRRLELEPQRALTDAYPALRGCVSQGYLVSAGSEQARPLEVSFAPGQRVAGGTVVRCVQALEDSELHQLALDSGAMAALKVLRPACAIFDAQGLRREAVVLRHLDGRVAPRLLQEGATDGRPWLAMEWCAGVPASRAAAAARQQPDADRVLLGIASAIAEAYACLHEAGVVHADVHPGNVLVASEGVRLVDFGLARVTSSGAKQHPPRGAVPTFHDPQHAAASRSGLRPGPASFASDQFSLGALLYELLTGSPYLDFSLETDEMLRQIVEDGPLAFAQRGRRPWPEIEELLTRALAKTPRSRLPSTRELAQRLSAVAPPASPMRRAEPDCLESILRSVLAKARPGGGWFDDGLPSDAPTCSVVYGAAGVAVALYRAAVLRAEPELLALADEWSVRAAREAASPQAFHHDDLDVTVDTIGQVSPFHCISGVHAVQALVSHALGDVVGCRQALDSFVAESRHRCANVDLTVGRSGTLLAAGLVLETVDETNAASTKRLVELGSETLAGIWAQLDRTPPVAESDAISYLGIAHGWAGVLFATLRWCEAARVPVAGEVVDRLDQLAQLARPCGLGATWPIVNSRRSRNAGSAAGWCHGSAGHVHLWTTAHRLLGDDRWRILAEQAAFDAQDARGELAQLCCGLGGQAYAMLCIHRHTGERRWLDAASQLGARAAAHTTSASGRPSLPASLHKGDVGLAALAVDIADPESAAMPFFGSEA